MECIRHYFIHTAAINKTRYLIARRLTGRVEQKELEKQFNKFSHQSHPMLLPTLRDRHKDDLPVQIDPGQRLIWY